MSHSHPNLINVLMVDDDEKDFAFIDKLFRLQTNTEIDKKLTDDHNFRIFWAVDVPSALVKLKERDYDVILLDYNLPAVEGLDALKALLLASPLTPIVMLTGMDSEKLGVDTILNGAQDYLIKSNISRQTLLKTVRYAIARFNAIQQGVAAREWDERFLSHISALRDLRTAVSQLPPPPENLRPSAAPSLSPSVITEVLEAPLEAAPKAPTEIPTNEEK